MSNTPCTGLVTVCAAPFTVPLTKPCNSLVSLNLAPKPLASHAYADAFVLEAAYRLGDERGDSSEDAESEAFGARDQVAQRSASALVLRLAHWLSHLTVRIVPSDPAQTVRPRARHLDVAKHL